MTTTPTALKKPLECVFVGPAGINTISNLEEYDSSGAIITESQRYGLRML